MSLLSIVCAYNRTSQVRFFFLHTQPVKSCFVSSFVLDIIYNISIYDSVSFIPLNCWLWLYLCILYFIHVLPTVNIINCVNYLLSCYYIHSNTVHLLLNTRWLNELYLILPCKHILCRYPLIPLIKRKGLHITLIGTLSSNIFGHLKTFLFVCISTFEYENVIFFLILLRDK